MKKKILFLVCALALLMPAITFGQVTGISFGCGAAGVGTLTLTQSPGSTQTTATKAWTTGGTDADSPDDLLGTYGSDPIRFATGVGNSCNIGNARRMIITAGGNVGIGQYDGASQPTNPENKLLVESGTIIDPYIDLGTNLGLLPEEIATLSYSNRGGGVGTFDVGMAGLVSRTGGGDGVGVLGAVYGAGPDNFNIGVYADVRGANAENIGIGYNVEGATSNVTYGLQGRITGSDFANLGTDIVASDIGGTAFNIGVAGEAKGGLENVGVAGAVETGAPLNGECTGVLGHISMGGQGSIYNFGVHGDLDNTAPTGTEPFYAVVGTISGIGSPNGSIDFMGPYPLTFAGYFEGDVFSGDTYYSSDEKLKKDIKDYSGALKQLQKLPVKKYTFNNEKYPGMNLPLGERMGVMAADMKEVFPNLVKKAASIPGNNVKKVFAGSVKTAGEAPGNTEQSVEFDAVNYDALIPVLIQGTKELAAKIEPLEQLEAKVKAQDDLISEINKQITELKNLVNELCNNGCGEFAPTGINTPSANPGVKLFQNIPNPGENSTTINYAIDIPFNTAGISVVDIQGRGVRYFEIGQTGSGSVNFVDQIGTNATYKYSLVIDGKIYDTKTMMMIKN